MSLVQIPNISQPSSVAWMELAVRILETIGQQAIRWKQAEHERFKSDLAASAEFLRKATGDAPLRIVGDAVAKGIRTYSEQTQRCIDASQAEMKEMIRLLTSSLRATEANSEEMFETLDEVAGVVQATDSLEDLIIAKARLADALVSMKEAAAARRQNTFHLLNDLQERLFVLQHWGDPAAAPLRIDEPVHNPVPAAASPASSEKAGANTPSPVYIIPDSARPDPATGLPGKMAADAAILNLGANPDHRGVHVGVFSVQRMQWINARYGEKFGNSVLNFCAQFLARGLQAEDQLFRWSGPCFVALLDRGGSVVDVRQDVQRMCASKITFESPNAAMLLPISIATRVIETAGASSPEIIAAIDEFVLSAPAG